MSEQLNRASRQRKASDSVFQSRRRQRKLQLITIGYTSISLAGKGPGLKRDTLKLMAALQGGLLSSGNTIKLGFGAKGARSKLKSAKPPVELLHSTCCALLQDTHGVSATQ
jgi:hypothetical protein